MMIKINNRISGLLKAWLCIAALILIGMPAFAQYATQQTTGQAVNQTTQQTVNQALSGSGPEGSYCVGQGYNYATIAGLNSGKPVCQFPDGTWCDGHAFFIGNCSANPSNYSNPYLYNGSQGALELADATKTCQKMGGDVQRVHTAYGDVNLCVFPDGSSVDLMALYNGAYSGVYGPIYNPVYAPINDSIYGPVYSGDNWYYYAYSWLNAP